MKTDPIAVALERARALMDEAKRIAAHCAGDEFTAAVVAAQAELDHARALLAAMEHANV